jgi:hypothetical protein
MAEIISFEDHKQQRSRDSSIVEKVIDGEIVECVNVDALTAIEQQKFLSRK